MNIKMWTHQFSTNMLYFYNIFVMNIIFWIGVILILSATYYIVNELIKMRLTDSFLSTSYGSPMMFSDENYRPVTNRSQNSHQFLNTDIILGKHDISNIKENNPNWIDQYFLDISKEKPVPTTDVVTQRMSKLKYAKEKDKITCIDDTHPVSSKLSKFAPYMYDDKPALVKYYDQPLYRDWRFQEKPIDIRFASNPEKFCASNPNVYPCYKYYSRW